MNIHFAPLCAPLALDCHPLHLNPAHSAPANTASAPLLRSAEILRAVRGAFVEKGFEGASMQDLARAAGMSVGNFYRYFPSKDAIVAQMIALDMAEVEGEFARILQSSQPMQALRAVIEQRITTDRVDGKGQLWAEIAATAQRKPDIADCACQMETTVASYLMQVFAVETGLKIDAVQQRFALHAHYIILLIRSAAMATPNKSGDSADLTPLILRSIDQLLGEIASAGLKGT